ncbi:nitrate- and nitrite sensing domain-containing protein [Streptomyces sp. NPDC052236]|uniref:sensor histidine kinase n=1 Tax=Streptomyces sp. NPDC052236 TaxID=3365686 RepID=UPI0037CDB1EA
MRRSMTSSAQQQARGNFTPPTRTAASPANTPSPPPPPAAGSSSRLAPRNWRVPTRLNAILLIPALVGLVMGGFQVKSSIDTWSEAQDAEKIAGIVRSASEYSTALLNERDLTAQPILEGKRTDPVVVQARATTDQTAAAFREAVKDMPKGYGLERRLQLVNAAEPGLKQLRQLAYTTSQDPTKTEEGYVKIEHLLLEFSNELGLGTGNVTSYGRTVYAISLAKGAESLQRSIGMHLLVKPSADANTYTRQVTAFTSYAYLEGIALQEYVSGGTEADAAQLTAVMKAKQEEGAKQVAEAKQKAATAGQPFVAPPPMATMLQAIVSSKDADQLARQGITPATWMATATAKFDGYTEVETDLVNKAVAEAAAISDDAKQDAIINGAIVLLALLTAFILAGLMAGQMSRAMRQLRTAAFSIAEQRLPMLVDQLSRTEPGRVDTRVQPIPINTRDEIGEVARAFDQVHREAVRLASEQAMLRGNVNAIFTNLSRRNQSLIEGQLTLITDLENNEADPDQLENLFRLDHLATRMRRNGENLLVLAGEEPGRRWNQPVPLVDVLRAASSEVESYERIELSGVPETEIHGQAVTDLVHLLAELLENATMFSSPQTKVRVTATRLPDGRVMIEIHDKGIGLTAEDFADINHKLANPPTVDAAVSQRMGLFVVGRLADRHGVRVQLRPSGEQAGTTSLVMLPDAITHGGGGGALPEDDFTLSQIMPEPEAVYEPPPLPGPTMRTAAELGFDDSRYETPSEPAPQLDPVGRSLLRKERRAALEAQATAGDQGVQAAQGFAPAPEQQAYAPAPEYGQDYTQQQYVPEQQPQQQAYEGFEMPTGYAEPQEQHEQQQEHQPQQQHPQAPYAEANYNELQPPEPQYDGQFAPQPHQAEWPDQNAYQGGYQPEYQPESESAPSVPGDVPESVGFERPGPSPSSSHELTNAGLPRRGSTQQPQQPQSPQSPQPESPQQWQLPAEPAQPEGVSSNGNSSSNSSSNGNGNSAGPEDWRSTNDDRWQRAEKLREPKAGGVTPSGLPRRVPKANLVEGKAEQTPQEGPQVSRAPEDVRGRLSNLRRGVQQGRNAGTDTNGLGFGPGSTYNQER